MDLQNSPKASVLISALRESPLAMTLVNRGAPCRSTDRLLAFATKIGLMAFCTTASRSQHS